MTTLRFRGWYKFERDRSPEKRLASPKSDQAVDMEFSRLGSVLGQHLADPGATFEITTPPGKPMEREVVITSANKDEIEIMKAVQASLRQLDLSGKILP